MSVLMDIFAVIGIMTTFTVAWWAMLESQIDIPGVNEPGYRRKGKRK